LLNEISPRNGQWGNWVLLRAKLSDKKRRRTFTPLFLCLSTKDGKGGLSKQMMQKFSWKVWH
jgi:hypothetical protein